MLVFQSVDRLWPNRLCPIVVLSCLSVLAKFCCCCRVVVLLVCCCCVVVLLCCCVAVQFLLLLCCCFVWFCLVVVVGLDSARPASARPPSTGALRRTAQNFALFLPFPATVSLFLCLSGGLLVEYWWWLKQISPKSANKDGQSRNWPKSVSAIWGVLGLVVWVFRCLGVWVFRCSGVQVFMVFRCFRCSGVWVFGCLGV